MQDPEANLKRAMEQFKHDNPEVVEAISAMNISFEEYLKALAAQQTLQSITGNANARLM
jgi:hypothetical protein